MTALKVTLTCTLFRPYAVVIRSAANVTSLALAPIDSMTSATRIARSRMLCASASSRMGICSVMRRLEGSLQRARRMPPMKLNPRLRSDIVAPLPRLEESIHASAVRRELHAVRRDPRVVVVGAGVPRAAVADERHDGSALAAREHSCDEAEGAREVRARGSARPVQRAIAQQADRGDGFRVRNTHHLVDDGRDERRLDARTADALDAARAARRV